MPDHVESTRSIQAGSLHASDRAADGVGARTFDTLRALKGGPKPTLAAVAAVLCPFGDQELVESQLSRGREADGDCRGLQIGNDTILVTGDHENRKEFGLFFGEITIPGN